MDSERREIDECSATKSPNSIKRSPSNTSFDKEKVGLEEGIAPGYGLLSPGHKTID